MRRKIATSNVLQAQEEDIYNADASFPENVRNGSGESSKIATSGEVEEDLYNADASFPENVRNESGESSKIATSGEVERSLDDLEQWKAKFSSDLKSIDADLIFKTMEFFHEAELLPLEVGNTEGPIDDTKYRKDHSKLKVVIKDCLDSLWSKLHFKKVELEEVFALGIQITGTRWTIYSISYDISQNFYFFFEIKHTLIDLVKKIQIIAQKQLNMPSLPSLPLHSTINSPPSVKKQKKDPFRILDNLY
ncbi:hypothetical protein RhiirA4_508866 [Rhizophagus irregularis]|uniref:Uncharacterized protein n=1 Tax=Rhizophagus irregularis TaxID=588596 RepID=A0A2I1HDQ9_9GLOM|nr:hypothetical protein RhiirA4_508866 [Rhizophagus irregularis]